MAFRQRFLPVERRSGKQKRVKKGRSLTKGRGGFGGPWRFFIHDTCRGGGAGRGGGNRILNFAGAAAAYRAVKRRGLHMLTPNAHPAVLHL